MVNLQPYKCRTQPERRDGEELIAPDNKMLLSLCKGVKYFIQELLMNSMDINCKCSYFGANTFICVGVSFDTFRLLEVLKPININIMEIYIVEIRNKDYNGKIEHYEVFKNAIVAKNYKDTLKDHPRYELPCYEYNIQIVTI